GRWGGGGDGPLAPRGGGGPGVRGPPAPLSPQGRGEKMTCPVCGGTMHTLLADIWDDLPGRGLGAVIGLILGALIAWGIARWRRMRERRRILHGDARDTVVINQHLLDRPPGGGPPVLRIRALGQGQLRHVVPTATSPSSSA